MKMPHPDARIWIATLALLVGGLLAACSSISSEAGAGDDPPASDPIGQAPTEEPNCYGINEAVDTPPLSVDFLMDFATEVFVAKVKSIEAGVWNTRNGDKPPKGVKNGPRFNPGIVTPINLQVDTTLLGGAGPGAIRVVNPGGTTDCVEHNVSNAPVLEKGKTYVFFLQPSSDAEGVKKPELPQVIAAWLVLADGSVETAVEGVLPLNDVQALVDNPVPPPVEPEPTPAGTNNPG